MHYYWVFSIPTMHPNSLNCSPIPTWSPFRTSIFNLFLCPVSFYPSSRLFPLPPQKSIMWMLGMISPSVESSYSQWCERLVHVTFISHRNSQIRSPCFCNCIFGVFLMVRLLHLIYSKPYSYHVSGKGSTAIKPIEALLKGDLAPDLWRLSVSSRAIQHGGEWFYRAIVRCFESSDRSRPFEMCRFRKTTFASPSTSVLFNAIFYRSFFGDFCTTNPSKNSFMIDDQKSYHWSTRASMWNRTY